MSNENLVFTEKTCYTKDTEKGRRTLHMMKMELFAFDDVDDLIFLDTVWDRSER